MGKFVFNRCRPVCPGSTADHAKYSQTELKNNAGEQAWYLHHYMLLCPMHFCFLIFFVNVRVCALHHCKHGALRQSSIHKQRPHWPDSRQPSQASPIAKPLSRHKKKPGEYCSIIVCKYCSIHLVRYFQPNATVSRKPHRVYEKSSNLSKIEYEYSFFRYLSLQV